MKHKLLLSLLPLYIVLLLDTAGSTMITPLFKPLFYQGNGVVSIGSDSFRNLCYGLSLFGFFTASIVGPAIIGVLSDQVGRKLMLLVCLLGSAFGYGLAIVAINYHSMSVFLLGRVIDGFTAGNFVIAQSAILNIASKPRRAVYMGYSLLAISLGFIVGPISSGLLVNFVKVTENNLVIPFYLIGVMTILNILFIAIGFKEVRSQQKVKIHVKGIWLNYVNYCKQTILRSQLLLFAALQFAWAMYIQYVLLYLSKEQHFSLLKLTCYSSLMGVGLTVGLGYLMKRLVSRFSLVRMTWLMSIVMLILLPLNLFGSSLLSWVIAIPLSAALAIAYTALSSSIAEKVDAPSKGEIMGLLGSISAICFAASGLLDGLLPSISAYLPFAVICIVFAIMVLWQWFGYLAHMKNSYSLGSDL